MLLAKIARNFTRSRSGVLVSSASDSTRALKSMFDSSRLRYLSRTVGLVGATPVASTFLTAFKASMPPRSPSMQEARPQAGPGPAHHLWLAYQRAGAADGGRDS